MKASSALQISHHLGILFKNGSTGELGVKLLTVSEFWVVKESDMTKWLNHHILFIAWNEFTSGSEDKFLL